MYVNRRYDALEASNDNSRQFSPRIWKFRVGEWVTIRGWPAPSKVMVRCRAGGSEVYGVRSFAPDDFQRDRVIVGEWLMSIEGSDYESRQFAHDYARHVA